MRTETEALLDIANAKIQDLQAKLDNEKENFRVFNFDYEKIKSQLSAKDALLDEAVKALVELYSSIILDKENHISGETCAAMTDAERCLIKIQEKRRKE